MRNMTSEFHKTTYPEPLNCQRTKVNDVHVQIITKTLQIVCLTNTHSLIYHFEMSCIAIRRYGMISDLLFK